MAEETPPQRRWDWSEPYRAWETWAKEGEKADPADARRAAEAARACTGCRGLDRSDERRVFEMPTDDKVRWCEVYRRRGDALRVEGQHARASLWYGRSLSYYEYTFPDDDATIARLEATRLETLLGLADADFFNKLLLDVLNHCYQALKIDETNPRALVRRAATYRKLDRYDEAQADLDAVPKDHEAAREEYRKLDARRRAYVQRSKLQCRRIVGGLAGGREDTDTNMDTQAELYRNLMSQQTGVLPPPLSAKDRDALDDLYVPIEAAPFLDTFLSRTQLDALTTTTSSSTTTTTTRESPFKS
ncbi:hypothetical protein CTAYLR_000785 [Chrysophaeum taylorii]|uniref:Uncharacterized protein n=1 Tax=Chrysophaeum taylorii TaxID=2483200 RepID=A0AAD7UQS3_9STRA|nr:hypothetical protein CTAYLR_000785 [Chrysophaeum taylorii]